MVSKKLELNQFVELYIQNPDQLCEKLKKYDCRITFKHNNIEGNVKSVLSVLGMCASYGDEILISCEGKDEKNAMKEIAELFQHRSKK